MPTDRQGVFARQATGLVRQLSFWDAFVFNASFVNIGLAVLYMVLYVPGWHPGGSMVIATVAAAVIAIPTSLVYGMLAAVFPRSGGEYVYVSRVLGPRWGVVASWNLLMWAVFYVGVPCALFARYGMAPLFRFLGITYEISGMTDLATWFSTPLGTFLTGTVTLLAILVLYVRGTRTWARVQNVLFYAGVAAILAAIAALAATRSSEVTQQLAHYFGHLGGTSELHTVVQTKAAEYGIGPVPLGLLMTFLVLSWPCYNLFWANASTYFGGEVQQPARTQVLSLPIAVIFSGLSMAVLLALTQSRFGLATLGALGRAAPSSFGLTFKPTFNELCAAVSPHPILGVVVLVGFLYWCLAWAPVTIGAITRGLLAWSLDRLAPARFSEVHPRLHTPVFALLFCGLLGEVSLFLFSFIPTFGLLVGMFGVFLTFIIASVAGMLLPFRR